MNSPIYGGNLLKRFILLQALKEEAHKQLSYYRQKQDDLVARMATEWPTWGCTLDFYSHMILPLLKNPFILNFINRSEGFGLNQVDVKFGHMKKGELNFVEEEFQLPPENKLSTSESVKIEKADLVDFCISLFTNVTDVKIRSGSGGIPVSEALLKWRIKFNHRDPLLVRIRDADIGAQSFFAFLEGVMRNASKHGIPNPSEAVSANSQKTFKVHIVFCCQWDELTELVELDDENQDAEGYSFVAVSVSRDFVNDPSSDPSTPTPRKIGDDSLVEFLRKQFNEGIIDEKGKVTPGNWGIKEMKTCAAFLGGESLYAVNDREPKFILIGKTKGNKIWCDGLSRLCYVVRVETPRLALALVPEHKNPQGHWNGVRFVTEPEELLKGNVDYDFLYIDKEMSDWKKKVSLSRLPQRVVEGDCLRSDFGEQIKDAETGGESLPKELELSYRLYDEVLAQHLEMLGERGKRFRLRLYFEDNERAEAWEEHIDNKLELRDDQTIDIDFLKIAGNSPPNKFEPDYDYYQASIFRHTQLSAMSVLGHVPGQKIGDSYYPYYAQQVSGSDPFFSFLLSLEPKDNTTLGNLVMRQIAEAVLLNVLIIDERIAQSLGELKAKDEPNIHLSQKLCWMGIQVAGSLRIAGDPEPIWQADNQHETLPTITFNEQGFIDNKMANGLPIHILLIHATRLNGIYDRLSKLNIVSSKEDLLTRLKTTDNENNKQDRTVIVHSGRGKTEGDIPESAPFLEYSTVEKYVLNEPSKFYLVQIVRNVKGDKK
jgi:hypothetical protein